LEEDDESVSAIFWCSRSVTVPSRLIYELLNRVWFYLFLGTVPSLDFNQ
jgi:hypothetical protein